MGGALRQAALIKRYLDARAVATAVEVSGTVSRASRGSGVLTFVTGAFDAAELIGDIRHERAVEAGRAQLRRDLHAGIREWAQGITESDEHLSQLRTALDGLAGVVRTTDDDLATTRDDLAAHTRRYDLYTREMTRARRLLERDQPT